MTTTANQQDKNSNVKAKNSKIQNNIGSPSLQTESISNEEEDDFFYISINDTDEEGTGTKVKLRRTLDKMASQAAVFNHDELVGEGIID